MDWLKKILNYKGNLFGAAYISDLNCKSHSLYPNYIF